MYGNGYGWKLGSKSDYEHVREYTIGSWDGTAKLIINIYVWKTLLESFGFYLFPGIQQLELRVNILI